MAQLIYSVIMSLDGYTADADGDIEWAAPDDRVLRYAPGGGHRQDPRRA